MKIPKYEELSKSSRDEVDKKINRIIKIHPLTKKEIKAYRIAYISIGVALAGGAIILEEQNNESKKSN